MARLERGQNEKIDRINDLVYLCHHGSKDEVNSSMEELLGMFKPMLLGLCDKWCRYFNDKSHNMISFNELMCDAEYWFYYYTVFKYEIDGAATYNKFIKDHMDQRIRYIYECQLKYYKNHIFPDPDKSGDNDTDMLEQVIYNYAIHDTSSHIEQKYIDDDELSDRTKLAHYVVDIVKNSNRFNKREKDIFIEIVYNGVTHEEMSKRLNISRTRVTQLLRKIKQRLHDIMDEDEKIWELVIKLDIDFEE